MKQKFKITLINASVLTSLLAALPSRVNAQFFDECADDADLAQTDICRGRSDVGDLVGEGSILNSVIQILVYVIGAVAVLMIVIGALRYVLSVGDPQKASQAKNTIIYAIVGVVLALMAQTILTFVLERL